MTVEQRDQPTTESAGGMMATASHPTAPEYIGQATTVEMRRAQAEVEGAIIVAQRVPRNVAAAVAEMVESCQQTKLAERAFFSFPRAQTRIIGPTIHLAREIARCWRNVQHGVVELRRDDIRGESEMQAWAWDVQANVRSMVTFVVPHKRDVSERRSGGGPRQPVPLIDLRDIYENNANMAARRLREVIFAVLPTWYVEKAKETANHTLANPTDGKPFAERVAQALEVFKNLGVTQDQLEQRLNRDIKDWTPLDLAQLQVIYGTLSRGEATREDEFPPRRVTPDEIRGSRPAEKRTQPKGETS